MKTTASNERLGRVGPRRQIDIPRDLLETLRLQTGASSRSLSERTAC